MLLYMAGLFGLLQLVPLQMLRIYLHLSNGETDRNY